MTTLFQCCARPARIPCRLSQYHTIGIIHDCGHAGNYMSWRMPKNLRLFLQRSVTSEAQSAESSSPPSLSNKPTPSPLRPLGDILVGKSTPSPSRPRRPPNLSDPFPRRFSTRRTPFSPDSEERGVIKGQARPFSASSFSQASQGHASTASPTASPDAPSPSPLRMPGANLSAQTAGFAPEASRSVGYWLLASAASVFGLVIFGGLTRLTESG